MAISVSVTGYGIYDGVDALTNINIAKIAGSGGTPSAVLTGDGIHNGESATVTVNKTHIAIYSTAASLNFDTGGGQEGQMIYVWGNFLAAGLLNTQAAGGFGVILYSGTAWREYYFYGSDNYAGGYARMVIDPTKTASASSGTFNINNITGIGVFANVGGNTGRFDNLILDRIDVGTGLTITGSTTNLYDELLAWDETSANRTGMFQALNKSKTALELLGALDISGTHNAESSKIFLAEPTYYNGTSVVPSVPVDYFSINHTGASTIQYGIKVGTGDTARGRSGVTISGNSTYDLGIDFDDGSVASMKVYGSTFEFCTGALTWGTNGAHELIGSTFNACGQFDPVGGIVIRNCVFSGYTLDTDAALLWNENINIKNCSFIANTDGTNSPAAIEHPASTGTPYTYDSLVFSGNDFDVNNTSGNAISVTPVGNTNVTADDPDKGSAVTVLATSYNFTINLNPAITGYEWRLYTVPTAGTLTGSVELDGEEVAGSASQSYSHTYTNQTVAVQIISDDYVESVTYYTLTQQDQTQTINLDLDTND